MRPGKGGRGRGGRPGSWRAVLPMLTVISPVWWVVSVLWGQVRERAAIGVRGRERSRVLCFYGVSDVAACWNPRGMVPVR